jgi:hypothetical protein
MMMHLKYYSKKIVIVSIDVKMILFLLKMCYPLAGVSTKIDFNKLENIFFCRISLRFNKFLN